MSNIQTVTGTGVPLFLDDIETERIIPARYLRCVTCDGLGEHAFEDDREQTENHPFDDARFADGGVLVVGRNFGCGSSREHAPQSLSRWGIQAIVGESFAEIFFGNCTSLGIPCVCVSRADAEQLAATVEADPLAEITVDLVAQEVRSGDKTVACEMPESARTALTTGQFDFLAQLLEGQDEIAKTAEALPYMSNFA